MISSKFGRLLLPSLGIAMLVLAAFAVAPVAAQSGTATPQAGQTSQATAMPQATPVVPQTGAAQAQCFTYNDLVNQNLQPGSLYYMANSGDTLQGIANMFGVTEQQLIQANNGLTTFGQQAAVQATQAAPAAGTVNLNDCIVSGASQPLDQGQVDGQNYVLAQGMLLQIPVSASSLIPATGGQAQATPSAEATQATPSAEATQATPSAEATQATPSVEATQATPSAEATQATPSAETTQAAPSAQATQAVPQTGANFSLNPGELQNRIFMYGDQGKYMDGFYVAQNGNSLSRLANRWGVSLSQILNVNPEIQNPNIIFRGEAIRVPSSAYVRPEPNIMPAPSSTPGSSSVTSTPSSGG